MWEAFLLQMNDFDRFLELKLREMLDPVVEVQPPARDVKGKRQPSIALVADPIAVPVEPVAVPVPVAPLHSL